MSPTMWDALAALPIVLALSSVGWFKPVGSPTAFTLDALESRGFAAYVHEPYDPPRWERTKDGDAALESRPA